MLLKLCTAGPLLQCQRFLKGLLAMVVGFSVMMACGLTSSCSSLIFTKNRFLDDINPFFAATGRSVFDFR